MYDLICKRIEANGGKIICHDREKKYLDGRLPNGHYFFVQIKNEHETEVRVNDFGGFYTTIASTAVVALLQQLGK